MAVVDAHGMERGPADGAGVSLLSPGSNAGIVNDVVAPIQSSDDVEVVGVLLDGFRLDGSCNGGWCQLGVSLGHGSGRGARQRIQAYDALVWFRHDVVGGGVSEV